MGLNWKSASLAALALAGFTGPAMANDTQGWYLGLGVGFDSAGPLGLSTPSPSVHSDLGREDAALIAGSFGYKWASNLRMEFEVGYTQHDQRDSAPPFAGTVVGTNEIKSALVNVIYDWNLGSRWSVSVGGGVGGGIFGINADTTASPGIPAIRGNHAEFMWQGIVGLNFEVAPDLEIFADYRYRATEIDRGFDSGFAAFNPVHVSQAQENVGMLGVRWFVAPPGH